MCSIFNKRPTRKVAKYYDAAVINRREYTPSIRVFPKSMLPIVIKQKDSNEIEFIHWGLKPAWIEKIGKSNELINVRADSLLKMRPC